MVIFTKSYINLRKFPFLTLLSQKRCKHFITTPIFYVNSVPHLGHLYSAVLADAYNRFLVSTSSSDLSGYFIFSTGTDEHGIKIQNAAQTHKLPTKDHCGNVSKQFNKMCCEFGVEYTDFIRTTETRHFDTVKHLWQMLKDNGFIYKSHYEGWYCESDETFVSSSAVTEVQVPGKKSRMVSEESGHPVEWSSEENYMFRLSEFQKPILEWLRKDSPVFPSKFNSIAIRYAEECTQDLSVSRPLSRSSWGIPVPDDETQVIYVWLDALANYLTVSGYPGTQSIWPPTLQVIGKDILKFHAIYWPAFLMAAKLELPQKIFCHSHWVIEGQKMSKSLGNVVDPFLIAKKYSTEGVRYFLLQEGVPHSDGNFTEEKLRRLLNSELADTLGNLLSRCSAKTINPGQVWPTFCKNHFHKYQTRDSKALIDSVEHLPAAVASAYSECNFHKGIDQIMTTVRLANVYVQNEKPWELVKVKECEDRLFVLLSIVFEVLRVSSIMLWPIVPNVADKILSRLNVPDNKRKWKDIQPFMWSSSSSAQITLGNQKDVLFRRVKAE